MSDSGLRGSVSVDLWRDNYEAVFCPIGPWGSRVLVLKQAVG